MRLIGVSLPGPRSTTLRHPRTGNYKVLFIRYERIGDMIMATSLIRVIAQTVPGRKLDVLATPTTAPVLEGNPHVGNILTLDRRSWGSYIGLMKKLRRAHYDVMVDGRINNPPVYTSTPLLMLAGGAPYRVGAAGARNSSIYNVCVPEWNRREHYIDGSKQLAIPFGVDPAKVDWQPEIFLTVGERDRAEREWVRAAGLVPPEPGDPPPAAKRLLINLSASETKRRWPDGKFIATLTFIRSRAPLMSMIIIGLPREWKSVQEVATATGAHPVATPKLRDAFALVGTADIVFTPDTSISHAASAFRKPSLVLLKREHKPYAPYGTPGEIVSWSEPEIQQLPHERVSAALDTVISRFGVN
ncbi:MAG TPA: glycosyltransferase family 9 protein [Gemmatimonadaceae bacterium]|nr:glycosyltransferase family 9 protein [Gemmatimonadaceae bacterium]